METWVLEHTWLFLDFLAKFVILMNWGSTNSLNLVFLSYLNTSFVLWIAGNFGVLWFLRVHLDVLKWKVVIRIPS